MSKNIGLGGINSRVGGSFTTSNSPNYSSVTLLIKSGWLFIYSNVFYLIYLGYDIFNFSTPFVISCFYFDYVFESSIIQVNFPILTDFYN